MKKISANYIFPGNSAPIKNGVIKLDNNGVIESVLNPSIDAVNWDEVAIHKGIICPGFVNTHCHLELSYLKGKIAEKTQLHGFVRDIVAVREQFNESERLEAIVRGEQEMIQNGIVAVADISNGNTTFNQKAKAQLHYHTFLEVFGLTPAETTEIMDRAALLKSEYHDQNRISITTHSPYSMSSKLIRIVHELAGNVLTIHNQETRGENELFHTKSGKMYDQLVKMNAAIKDFEPTGKNSLPSYLPKLSDGKKILLVHNTYTSREDIIFARQYVDQIYWCFCPNANEYIEGTQPNYSLFTDEKCTIGTDSLASNWALSILDELKTIAKKNPVLPLQKLIKWATYNGAEFLEFEGLGSIEKGKSPGLNLIENVDLDNLSLTETSTVKPLYTTQQLINLQG